MKHLLIALFLLVAFVPAKAQEEEDFDNLFTKNYQSTVNLGIAKRWEYYVLGSFYTSSIIKGAIGEESASIEIALGYNFNNHVYMGLSSGYLHDFGEFYFPSKIQEYEGTRRSGDYLPVLLDARYRWNAFNKFAFYAEGRGGILLPTRPGLKVSGDEDPFFTYPSYFFYEAQPGVMLRTTRRFELRLSVGVGYAKSLDEKKAKSESVVSAKLGFAYRFSK